MTAPADHPAAADNGAALREELLRRRLGGAAARPRPEIPRVPRTVPLPLSAGQRQLWFLQQLDPDSPAYLLPLVHRLHGLLNTDALREAVGLLTERHEILRTRYVIGDGEPFQVVDPPGRPVFERTDRHGLTEAQRDMAAAEFTDMELRTPIDLAAGPPLRVRLLRLAPDDHLLVVVVHHIACDAFTRALLLTELGEFYRARTEHRAPRLPERPTQYADYAAWQNEQQRSAAAQRELAWWKEQLAGVAPLDLPTDRPRPTLRSWEGAEVRFTVPAETGKPLRDFAHEHGASLFTVLLTAFQVLLSRHTGAQDVTVGTAVSTRNRPELTGMAGYAYNSLALRARWQGDPSFTRLVQDNRERLLAALDHRSTPFDRLVDTVDPARDPASTPVFQVMLDLVTSDGDSGLRLPGVDARPVAPPCHVSRFDLTVHLEERQDGSLDGALEFATALFDATTAGRFAGHFTRLLASAAATPEAPAAALDLFDDTERALLLDGPKRPVGTARVLDLSALRPVHEDVRRQALRTPEAVAVVHGDLRMPYRELNALTDRIAGRLNVLGAGAEDTVAVLLDRGPDLVACLLGVWRTGAAYVPLDPGHPDERLAYILADTGTRLVVTERRYSDRLAGNGVRLVVIDDEDERAALLDCPPPPADTTGHDLDRLAYVIYTSGSTGRPKGVMVTHRGLANYLGWTAQAYASAGDGGAPVFSSIAFDLGMPDLFTPLLTGQPVHLIDQDVDIDDLGAKLLAGAPYAFVKLTPGHLDLLLRQLRPEQVARLAGLVIAAGDSFTGRLADRWAEAAGPGGTALAAEYGPTEITVGNSAYFVDGPVDTELVSIGRAIPHTTMLVLDEHLRPVPLGGVGEVCIGGIGVARGYAGRPELTAERFVPDPYGPAGSRMYRTGDLARVLPDGNVGFVSRTDHQVKLRGYRIELGEIENSLTADAAVAEAVVVVREDRPGDKRLVGYLVAAPGADTAALEPARLQALLARSLPSYMVPAAFVRLAGLPLTANGKLDRKALPAPGRAATAAAEHTAPRTGAESAMACVWAEVLGLDRVGVHDNFFDLGGDSLRAVALAGALRDAGTAVSVRDVFEHRTVARLCAAVGSSPVVNSPEPVAPFALIDPEDRDNLPADAVDAYPISRVQAGMIIEMFGCSGQNRYHNITSFRIRDDRPFAPDAFRAACALVVARHEVMRTSFALTGFSRPLQIVQRHATLPFTPHDLRHLPEPLRRRELEDCAARERAVLFTLSEPPLMRMNTHVLDDESWWLSITEAHPVIEGWSYHSQLMELLRSYERIRDGLEPDLPPVPGSVRFADFIAAELRALASDGDRSFWHRVLDENEQFRIPHEWAGPPASTPERYRIDIPLGDLEPGLRRLASATGTSYKSVLHSAHAKVLGLLAPPGAFRGGMVIDARPEAPGADRVSGMYLNSVPFPYPRATGTWGELVQEVYDREVGLWPHRRFPMPSMRRHADEGHLVDVLFHYLDFHQLDTDLVDITASRDDSPNEFALVVGTPSAGHLSIASDTRTLRRECGKRLARMYRAVLSDMARKGAEGDARRSYADDTEEPPTPLSGPEPAEALAAFEAQVRRTPDAVAVTAGARKVSYAELDARANGLAHRLRSLGAGVESRIGVLLDRGPDLVVTLLAVWKAGSAYVPVDPEMPDARVRALFTDSGCAMVVVEERYAERIGGLRSLFVDAAETSSAPVREGAACDRQRLAYVLHTSGSTGAPKGVMVSQHALAHYLGWAVENYLTADRGGAPVFTSIGSDLGVTALFAPLMCGRTVHLLPQRWAQADLGRQLLAYAPYAYVGLTPGHLALLEEQLSDTELASLTATLVCAGDAYPGDQADRVRARAGEGTRLASEYGPTEATVAAAAHRPDGPVLRSLVPLGQALPGTTLRVLDAGADPVPTGVVGELYIGGPGLARGYTGDPTLTAERFVPDPYGPPGARLYRTGDLARVLPDGEIEFCCRADDQIQVRGHRVEPAEIEAALAADPTVREALVAGVPGPAGEPRLTAWVVPTDARAASLSPVALSDRLRTLLPEPLVPARYVTIDALPLTAHGKRDRRALVTAAAAGRSAYAVGLPYRPPHTPNQRTLADVWRRTLGVDRVGLDDEFRALGGDSLTALSVLSAARRAGLDLDLATVLKHSTIAALAEASTLREVDHREAPSSTPLDIAGRSDGRRSA
ncbi:amino acid adenylation domain-containing protein [Streptomyces sp. NPDC050549]|uniref:amino acid adenylation domain-containing protein n=1 Tax=Streptomyces sp. NPDC050549 TaxID=3155406 RepID=UPI00341902E1